MKAKTVFTAVAGATLACALALTAAACGDGGKDGDGDRLPEGVKAAPTVNSVDTFVGAESRKTYSGEESAVKAFFADELMGEYVGYEKKGTLPASHVSKLGLADAQSVKTVTAVSVKFNGLKLDGGDEGRSSGVHTSADGQAERTFGAYTVEYNDGSFKYYSPRPDNGEVLTKSYYLSLIEGSKYANCKATYRQEEQEWREFMPEGGTSVSDLQQRMRRKIEEENFISADNIIVERESDSKYYTRIDGQFVLDEEIASEDPDPDIYVAERDGRAYRTELSYEAGGASWQWRSAYRYVRLGESGYYGYSGRADFDAIVFDTLFGHAEPEMFAEAFALFEKTSTGFKASEEAFKLIEIEGNPVDKYFYFDVDGGKIIKLDVGVTWDDDGDEIYNKYSITLSDFGNVEPFSLPDEYSTALDAFIAEEAANDAKYTVASAAAWTAAFDYSDKTNYRVRNDVDKQAMIEDKAHGYWTQTWYLLQTSSTSRDGDMFFTYNHIHERDWEYVDLTEYTYIYKDGGKWYAETPTDERDGETGELKWNKTETVAPQNKDVFSDYAFLHDKFDQFGYDVYEKAYVAVFEESGVEYCYSVRIENGKVVSVKKEYKEDGTYKDSSKVELRCVERISISDIDEVDGSTFKNIMW